MTNSQETPIKECANNGCKGEVYWEGDNLWCSNCGYEACISISGKRYILEKNLEKTGLQ